MRDLVADLGKGTIQFEFGNFFTVIFSRVYTPVLKKSSEKSSEKMSGKMSGKVSGKVLEFLLQNPEITIPLLADELEVSSRTIERALKTLQEQKKISRQGGRKEGAWIVH